MDCVGGSRSTDEAADIVRKCDPCSYKGLVNDARTYCGQCEEYMCVSCASAHSSLKMTRHHVCTTVTGHSLDDVINSLLSLKCRIGELKSDREKSAEDLLNLKKSCTDAVQQFKSRIIEKLDRLETKILAHVDKVIATETAVIQDQVQTCDSLIRDVEAELTTADGAKTAADDVASVVAAYELAKTLTRLEPTVSDLEGEACDVHITFQPSSKLADIISGVDQLGMLDIDRAEKVGVAPSASRSTGPVSGRKPVSDMDVISSTELSVPSNCITGSAVMPDGKIILADYSNKQIILLNPDFTILSTLALPGQPLDVAVYGDNAAVVTVPTMEKLQYIHVDTTLRAGHTIPTGLRCWGVAVHDGEIYVVVYDGDDGEVRVLDTRGKVTRSIGRVSTSYTYMYVTVGRGGTLYIADYCIDHIRCYTNAGDVVYDVQHKGMSGPCGMVVDEDDNLLVCCTGSNAIHVLGKDGAHRRVILSSADGVVSPQSVSYRRSDQTLIVTMYNNTPSCRAYQLK